MRYPRSHAHGSPRAVSVISLSYLTRIYDTDHGPVEALSDVTLDVSPGGLTAVSGPPGAGKSTLLNLLSGMDQPTSGSVFLGGELASSGALQRGHVSRVYPALSLVPHLNVADNITLGCAILGVEVEGGYLDSVLDIFHLGELLERFPRELTPQQQQRVAFARAFLLRPELVVADEPQRPLDPDAGLRLLTQVGVAARTLGQTVIVSTQTPVVAEVADRWILLAEGSVTADILSPLLGDMPVREHLPDSLDDIAPPPRLSVGQERLVSEARRILEDLPGPVQPDEVPEL